MYKLRELVRNDLCKINQWRNDPDVISYLGSPFRYICEEVDEKWYDCYLKNRDLNVRCAIVRGDDAKNILGLVSLININHINRSAEFHLMIGDANHRGKGLGFFATNEILNHAFQNLNLNRIQLEVLNTNEAAKNLYIKSGFIQEGLCRQAIYKTGVYQDTCIMAILRQEFACKKIADHCVKP
jgi:UDP-4-amino-4,6-dideoxy-N-acetyl-beta-L-altrosamine N-acetyltransferase